MAAKEGCNGQPRPRRVVSFGIRIAFKAWDPERLGFGLGFLWRQLAVLQAPHEIAPRHFSLRDMIFPSPSREIGILRQSRPRSHWRSSAPQTWHSVISQNTQILHLRVIFASIVCGARPKPRSRISDAAVTRAAGVAASSFITLTHARPNDRSSRYLKGR